MSRYGITIPFDRTPLADHKAVFEEIVSLGYTDVWSAEASGTDGFVPLAMAAAWAPTLRLGTAIIPSFTRGPATLAMGVATMADAAPGRFQFGLGTSSDVIVERWNDIEFTEPYKRNRDMVKFLRAALAGEKVTEEYETFKVRGFRLER
ncbi:MAG TPA: LLM class flavin-dependent oxidoreductase, partial [Acidimicrobiales bacterium]|nr:LLM class flavin-dependent oxidoreductase [Acidimicrobiales bacterium]